MGSHSEIVEGLCALLVGQRRNKQRERRRKSSQHSNRSRKGNQGHRANTNREDYYREADRRYRAAKNMYIQQQTLVPRLRAPMYYH
eukprot:IDg22735t1